MKVTIFLALFALLVLPFPGLAAKNTVEKLTIRFLEVILTPPVNPNEKDLNDFFDANSYISFQSGLPFAGEFTGTEGAALMYTSFLRSFKDIEPEVTATQVNEAKGIALIKMVDHAVFAHNEKKTDLALLTIIEWNQNTGKIMNLFLVDTDIKTTMENYQTNAEKAFDQMMQLYFKSTYEDLLDGKSTLWSRVCHDVKFTVHVYPEDILARTEWNGKDQAVSAFKEVTKLHMGSQLLKIVQDNIYRQKKNVFFSDNNNVWGSIQLDSHLYALTHYQFNDKGQLCGQDIYMAGRISTDRSLVYP